VADAIRAEQAGFPAAAVALEKLAKTTGRGMAAAHGLPDYPIAMIRQQELVSTLDNLVDESQLDEAVNSILGQVEDILLRGRVSSPQ
jgi:hypothetical protein